MNLRPFIFGLLFLALILESTFITFPLVFVISLILYFLYPDSASVIAGFIAGFIIDSLNLAPIGATSLAILLSFIFIELLRNVFEFKDNRIAIVVVGLLSYIYARTFSYMDNIILYAIIYLAAGFVINYFYKKSSWQK